MKVRHFIEWHRVETVSTSVDIFKLFYYVLMKKGGYVFRTILNSALTKDTVFSF